MSVKEKKRKKFPRWASVLLIAGLIAALGYFLVVTGFFESVRSMEDMRAYMERFYPYSYGVYFVVQLASVILAPIPSNVTSLAGAALFGTAPAFLLTYGAVALGSALVFRLARVLGQPFVERFVSRSDLEKYRAFQTGIARKMATTTADRSFRRSVSIPLQITTCSTR